MIHFCNAGLIWFLAKPIIYWYTTLLIIPSKSDGAWLALELFCAFPILHCALKLLSPGFPFQKTWQEPSTTTSYPRPGIPDAGSTRRPNIYWVSALILLLPSLSVYFYYLAKGLINFQESNVGLTWALLCLVPVCCMVVINCLENSSLIDFSETQVYFNSALQLLPIPLLPLLGYTPQAHMIATFRHQIVQEVQFDSGFEPVSDSESSEASQAAPPKNNLRECSYYLPCPSIPIEEIYQSLLPCNSSSTAPAALRWEDLLAASAPDGEGNAIQGEKEREPEKFVKVFGRRYHSDPRYASAVKKVFYRLLIPDKGGVTLEVNKLRPC